MRNVAAKVGEIYILLLAFRKMNLKSSTWGAVVASQDAAS